MPRANIIVGGSYGGYAALLGVVKEPVLLAQGKADSTVLVSHSTTMAKELRKHNVPTDLLVIEDADHHFLREDMRLTLYRKLEAFLATNLQAK